MWTPLQNGLGSSPHPQVEIVSADQTRASLEEIAASLTWFDRILLRAGIKILRRIIITVIGLTILLVGLVMVIAPGPATLVIPLGLAILAIEYAWARRLLRRLKGYVDAGLDQGAALLGKKRSPTGKPQSCVSELPLPAETSPSTEKGH